MIICAHDHCLIVVPIGEAVARASAARPSLRNGRVSRAFCGDARARGGRIARSGETAIGPAFSPAWDGCSQARAAGAARWIRRRGAPGRGADGVRRRPASAARRGGPSRRRGYGLTGRRGSTPRSHGSRIGGAPRDGTPLKARCAGRWGRSSSRLGARAAFGPVGLYRPCSRAEVPIAVSGKQPAEPRSVEPRDEGPERPLVGPRFPCGCPSESAIGTCGTWEPCPATGDGARAKQLAIARGNGLVNLKALGQF